MNIQNRSKEFNTDLFKDIISGTGDVLIDKKKSQAETAANYKNKKFFNVCANNQWEIPSHLQVSTT